MHRKQYNIRSRFLCNCPQKNLHEICLLKLCLSKSNVYIDKLQFCFVTNFFKQKDKKNCWSRRHHIINMQNLKIMREPKKWTPT